MKKRSVCFVDYDRMQNYRDIATRSLVHNKEDPGAFTISCSIGLLYSVKALCDLVRAYISFHCPFIRC